MTDFVVIDLFSQRHAVNRFLRDVSLDDRLAWLSRFGTLDVFKPTPESVTAYRFETPVGFSTTFFFVDRDFVFIGDHHTIPCDPFEDCPPFPPTWE